jgi:hypothetical protein
MDTKYGYAKIDHPIRHFIIQRMPLVINSTPRRAVLPAAISEFGMEKRLTEPPKKTFGIGLKARNPSRRIQKSFWRESPAFIQTFRMQVEQVRLHALVGSM